MGGFIEWSTNRITCKGGHTTWIHLMAQIIKHMMIVQHVFFVLGGNGNLIGDTPSYNRWMIVILNNQLLHLADGIITAIWHMGRNIRNLCPNHHTILITQIIKILVMLIMSKTNGITAHLTNELHILSMMCSRQCVANALSILMTGHTMQRISSAI